MIHPPKKQYKFKKTYKEKQTLREKRIENNMTQKQVAELAEISIQQYQKFEYGSRDLRRASFYVACRVLRALDMDIERFFDDGEESP